MMKRKLTDYFLDKPGTFEDQETDNEISLNLASKTVLNIKEGNKLAIDFSMNKQHFSEIKKRFDKVKSLKEDKDLQWCSIEFDSKFNQEDLYDIIDLSYESVLSTLTPEEKEEVLDLEW